MKTSKNICRLLTAAGIIAGALFTETSCTKFGFREGGSIRFSASNSAARTRTSYSKEGRTGSDGLLNLERIDWKDGDLITIYSPQAVMADGTDPVCDYRVDSHETLSGNLTSRAKVSPNAADRMLVWGTGTHYFYAVYPSAATASLSAAEKAKTGLDATRWKGTVAADQSPLANGLGGTASAPEIGAKMQYAHMFATATYDAEAPSVDLPFFPEFTAFEFQVGSGKNAVVDLTSFTLTAADGRNALAGDFAYLLADVDTETDADPLALSKFAFSNTSQSITVDFTKLAAGKLTVESGKPVTFTVIALPQEQSGLSITFTGDQIGTRTLKLNDSAGTPLVYSARQKHRLYGLSFPSVVTAGGEEIEWDQEAIGEDILWDAEYIFGNVSGTEIEGNLSPVTVEYTGGSGSLADAFVSYKTSDGGATKTAVPFTLEYSEDGGTTWSTTPPTWLSAAPAGGTHVGSATGEDLSVTASAQTGIIYDRHQALVDNGYYDTAKDLSEINVSGSAAITGKTTANCYVVDRPGNYKFPLVYGNGIMNGAVNESAYHAKEGVDGAYRPEPGFIIDPLLTPPDDHGEYFGYFWDHRDYRIMSPYIAEQHSGKAMSAVLVWEDVQDLVKVTPTISGSGQNAYISFTVPEATIDQGNALVALLVDDDNNGTPETIAWSWHIWVTEENLADVKEAPSGYKFASVNIGWCEGEKTTYAARSCQIRTTQEGSGLTCTATLSQTEGTVYTPGHNPYYQWGRKDPMQASNGLGNTDKTYFPSSPEYAPAVVNGLVSIGGAIQNPFKFYIGNTYDWCDIHFVNNWNSVNYGFDTQYTQGSTDVVKTVYDPSPVGYKVPQMTAYYGMQIELWGLVGGNNGMTVTLNGLFFPACGTRFYESGSLVSVGNIGDYWTANPWDEAFGADVVLYEGDYSYSNGFPKSSGFAVRPVQE